MGKSFIVLGTVAAIGGLAYLMTRKPSKKLTEEEQGYGAGVSISAEGIVWNRLEENEEYTASVLVINKSKQAGLPSEAVLTTHVKITIAPLDVITTLFDDTFTYTLVPGERRTINCRFTPPVGSGGANGVITAQVFGESDRPIAIATKSFKVIPLVVDYGADVTIG